MLQELLTFTSVLIYRIRILASTKFLEFVPVIVVWIVRDEDHYEVPDSAVDSHHYGVVYGEF